MTARAKFIVFVFMVIILSIGALFFGRDLPNNPSTLVEDDVLIEGDNPDGVVLGDENIIDEAGSSETSTTTDAYFREKLQEKFIAEVGQPIEGIEPQMLLSAYAFFEESDFDQVQAIQGIYTFVDGDLIFEQTELPEHSAARAISEEGMGTILRNIAERLSLKIASTDDVDMLLERIELKTEE